MQIAVAIAMGREDVGGFLPVGQQGNVLVVTLEENRRVVAQRLRALHGSESVPRGIHVICHEDFHRRDRVLSRAERIAKIVAKANGIYRPRLVIIDNLKELIDGNENDGAVVAEIMEALRQIATRERCAVLVVHHPSEAAIKRGSRGLLDATAARGHSNIAGYSRWMLNMAHTSRGAVDVMVTKVNYGPGWEKTRRIVLQHDGAGCMPSGFAIVEKSSRAMPAPGVAVDAYVDAVRALPEPLSRRATVDAVRVATGSTRAEVDAAIKAALEAGLLVEVPAEKGRGKVVRVA